MFEGKTSQDYRIKAVVRQQAFRIHVFDIDLRCRDGSELALIMGGYLWTKVGKRGSFRDAQFGRTDSTYFRGRLSERRLRGRLRMTDRLSDGTRCASRWIAFNATPRSGFSRAGPPAVPRTRWKCRSDVLPLAGS